MGIELKVSASAISAKKHSQNLDNYYLNGRMVQNFSEAVERTSKTTMADLQVYGVVDGGAESDNTIAFSDMARSVQSIFMQAVSELHEDLENEDKIDKELIWEAIKKANEQTIAVNSQKSYSGRKATLSFALLFLKGNKGMAVHLGDARIYVIRKGRILQITEDHTEFSSLVQNNIITREQMDIHKKSAKLTYYLGTDNLREARDVAFSKYFIFYPGDIFLLVSDGVTDVIRSRTLEQAAMDYCDGDPFEMGRELFNTAMANGDDDATMLVLNTDECEGTAPEPQNVRKESGVKNFAAGALSAVSSIKNDLDAKHADKEEEQTKIYTPGVSKNKKTETAGQDYKEDSQTRIYTPSEAAQNKFVAEKAAGQTEDYDDERDEEEENGGLVETIKRNPARYGVILAVVIFLFVTLIFILKSCNSEEEDSGTGESEVSVEESIEVQEESEESEESAIADESDEDNNSSEPDNSTGGDNSSEPDSSSDSGNSSSDDSKKADIIYVTAKRTDTYWGYCSKYYGSKYTGKKYTDALKKYNGGKGVMEGATYMIPPLEDLPVE